MGLTIVYFMDRQSNELLPSVRWAGSATAQHRSHF